VQHVHPEQHVLHALVPSSFKITNASPYAPLVNTSQAQQHVHLVQVLMQIVPVPALPHARLAILLVLLLISKTDSVYPVVQAAIMLPATLV